MVEEISLKQFNFKIQYHKLFLIFSTASEMKLTLHLSCILYFLFLDEAAPEYDQVHVPM